MAVISKVAVLDAVRAKRDVFFARVRHKGKLFRQSLETDVFTTAKLRLPDKLKELRKPKAEVGTFMDGRLKYEAETQNDYTLAPLSKTYRLRCVECLVKTWPGVDKLKVDSIKEADCRAVGGTLRGALLAYRIQ